MWVSARSYCIGCKQDAAGSSGRGREEKEEKRVDLEASIYLVGPLLRTKAIIMITIISKRGRSINQSQASPFAFSASTVLPSGQPALSGLWLVVVVVVLLLPLQLLNST